MAVMIIQFKLQSDLRVICIEFKSENILNWMSPNNDPCGVLSINYIRVQNENLSEQHPKYSRKQ